MKILMAEYQPWQHRVEDGEHKYARFFKQDGHQVFWLANFLNLNRLIRRREDDLAYLKLWRRGVAFPETSLQTFTPFAFIPYVRFPGLDSHWAAKTCLKYTVPSLKRTLVKQGFDHVDILWIGNPRLYSILDLVSYDILVYRMSDDVGNFAIEPGTIDEIEAKICRRADVVFATAQSLVSKAERVARHVCYLPNGVDFDLFNVSSAEIPADLAQIPEPRLIYVGVIGDWFDIESLEFAAKALPDHNFVIIGPVNGGVELAARIKKLKARNNVYVLNSRSFLQIPRYLQYSQVGLVPFIENEMTNSINPIKLFEYAAAGLPVVCRDLEEIRNLNSPALLYNFAEEFVTQIRTALQDREALQTAGVEFGRANSWARRYEVVKRELAMVGLHVHGGDE